MEEKFLAEWAACRERAAALGVRTRPVKSQEGMSFARRSLSGGRCSEGFDALAELGHLELSLEALAVDRRFTALFTDEEANTALTRLLAAGYSFPKTP